MARRPAGMPTTTNATLERSASAGVAGALLFIFYTICLAAGYCVELLKHFLASLDPIGVVCGLLWKSNRSRWGSALESPGSLVRLTRTPAPANCAGGERFGQVRLPDGPWPNRDEWRSSRCCAGSRKRRSA